MNSPSAPLWNGHSGHAWVDLQPMLDPMFQPLQDLLLEAVRQESPRNVLDVGCGTGSTTIAMAHQIGAQGRCTGIDISEPMIDTARARAQRENSRARFVRADAQNHVFAPAGFDMVVSRFGVMFFEHPVEAFANLRRGSREQALLNLIAWRSASENAFMTTAERAAAPYISLPERQPGVPGQFAFADRDRVTSMLGDSGWGDIDIQRVDVECTFPEKALTDYFTRLGPVGLALQQADEEARRKVIDVVRPAFDRYVHGDEVRYVAACWSIRARAHATPATTSRS